MAKTSEQFQAKIDKMTAHIAELKALLSQQQSNNKPNKASKTAAQISVLEGKLANVQKNSLDPSKQKEVSTLPPGIQDNLDEGAKFGDSLIAKFLPNIETIGGLLDEERTAENQGLLDKFGNLIGDLESRKNTGLTPAERQAIRESERTGIASNLATVQRGLGRVSGVAGVRGGALVANSKNQQNQILTEGRQTERDITQKSEDAKKQAVSDLNFALQGLTSAQSGITSFERDNAITNFEQKAKFQAGKNALFQGGLGITLDQIAQYNATKLSELAIKTGQENALLQSQTVLGAANISAESTKAFDESLKTKPTLPTPGNLDPLDLPQAGESNAFGKGNTNPEFPGSVFINTNVFSKFGLPGPGESNEYATVNSDSSVTFKPAAFG